MSGRPIVFIDTETTALGHFAQPWEIALIHRAADGDRELVWHVQDPLGPGTSPDALAVGGYFQRCGSAPAIVDGEWRLGPEWMVARDVHEKLQAVVLVGVGVHFDAAVLSAMFRRHGLSEEPWHYAIVDLKTASWGYLRARASVINLSPELEAASGLPVRSEAIAAALCVEPPSDEERHTALGDARWARRWFDQLSGGAS